jgi:hypothetical protein
MRTKQVRPDTLEFEFELYISREFDTTKDAEFILFDFHTVKVFENFEYKINVEPNIDVDGKVLEFNVEGLSAPVISLSRSGTAQYSYNLYGFKQTEYTLNLYKQRNDKNLFKFKVLKHEIKITRQPKKKFIKVIPQRVSEAD